MPLPIITIAQMRDWEKATWASGQTEAEVIRRVGLAVAHDALTLTRPGDLILILAGKGHNGGDARCAHDHLRDRRVNLVDVKDPKADLSRLEAELSLKPALVIDGLFGIGVNRPLNPDWIRFIERLNASSAPVLSVDVPSGLNADTGEPEGAAVCAAVTMTVGAPKRGMLSQSAWNHVGRLEVATDVGLVPCPDTTELHWTLAADFHGFPPARPVAGHKGTFGRLAIIGGSVGYHGAAVLAARGAQRARPGLITVFTHESSYQPVASQLQAVMVHPWSQEVELPANFDALLIGPGLESPRVPDALREQARRLWREAEIPVVVDASALGWLPSGPRMNEATRVITPHPGEAARMLGASVAQVQSDRPNAVRELSEKFGNTWVVLKGHQTLIGRDRGEIFINGSGNPFLAQGGAGDVLAGYLAGLLAQAALQSDALKTIRFGVWQHGAAADQLQRTQPNWIIEDLIHALGAAARG